MLGVEDKAGLNVVVTQQAFVMAFGALIACAGLILLFVLKEQAQSKIKLFGQEFEISTPALVVFLAGCAMFVMPLIVPIKNPDRPIVIIGPRKPIDGLRNGPPPLDGAQTIFEGVVAKVTRFEKTGGLVTVELTLQNSTTEPVAFCVEPHVAKLIDELTGDSWRQAHHGGEVWCHLKRELGMNQSHAAWMKFQVSNPERKRFALSLPILRRPIEKLTLEQH